ncbi:hypothetical protein CEB3_c42630 [Peptococcaceae bacterium CEB3]|nr:hypothetical protein CEB3_c42630 [Peptococcaceae bacterium CEB3]
MAKLIICGGGHLALALANLAESLEFRVTVIDDRPELATYLAGRYVEFIIYPFSFGELIELYKTIFPEASPNAIFAKYLTIGGMPYLSNLRYADQPSRQYLQDLYNSVVLKDIVKRNNIRNVDLLERIIAYITANVGAAFSVTSIHTLQPSVMRHHPSVVRFSLL